MYFQIIDKNRRNNHEVVTEGDTEKEVRENAIEYYQNKMNDDDSLDNGAHEFELIVRCVVDEDDMYSQTDTDWDLTFYKGGE